MGISYTGHTESLSTVFLRPLLGSNSSGVMTMHIFGDNGGVYESWGESITFYLKTINMTIL